MRTWLIAGLTPTALCNYAAGWIPVFLRGPLFHLTETFTYNSVVIKTCTAFYMLWAKNPEKLTIQWSAQTHSVTMQCCWESFSPDIYMAQHWPSTTTDLLRTVTWRLIQGGASFDQTCSSMSQGGLIGLRSEELGGRIRQLLLSVLVFGQFCDVSGCSVIVGRVGGLHWCLFVRWLSGGCCRTINQRHKCMTL